MKEIREKRIQRALNRKSCKPFFKAARFCKKHTNITPVLFGGAIASFVVQSITTDENTKYSSGIFIIVLCAIAMIMNLIGKASPY